MKRNKQSHFAITFDDAPKRRDLLPRRLLTLPMLDLHADVRRLGPQRIRVGKNISASIRPGRGNKWCRVGHGPEQRSNQFLKLVRVHGSHVLLNFASGVAFRALKDE